MGFAFTHCGAQQKQTRGKPGSLHIGLQRNCRIYSGVINDVIVIKYLLAACVILDQV